MTMGGNIEGPDRVSPGTRGTCEQSKLEASKLARGSRWRRLFSGSGAIGGILGGAGRGSSDFSEFWSGRRRESRDTGEREGGGGGLEREGREGGWGTCPSRGEEPLSVGVCGSARRRQR